MSLHFEGLVGPRTRSCQIALGQSRERDRVQGIPDGPAVPELLGQGQASLGLGAAGRVVAFENVQSSEVHQQDGFRYLVSTRASGHHPLLPEAARRRVVAT